MKKEENNLDYKIMIDTGIKFVEHAFQFLKSTIDSSSIAKSNKIEIDNLIEATLEKTLTTLEHVRLKLELFADAENFINKLEFEELEQRVCSLEKKVSGLGFATKADLRELELKLKRSEDE